jgi:alkyl hydroperoxide reductase subunit AhpC
LIGRNFYEILRLFDATQLTIHHKVVCPANWANGQEVMIHPAIDENDLNSFRFAEIRPWFRLTNPPEL